jgi:pantoate ligase / CMP/dCMP kinase
MLPPVFTIPAQLRSYLAADRDRSIGFVPTMGALHIGHESLIDRARRENDRVVVSIFVNPLQFGPQEDLARYPRQLADDRALCDRAGVDVIFAPTNDVIGISNRPLTQVVPPVTMTSGLCGKTRRGHFEGVATIVTKLLNIVQPDRAYFGEKDAQQLAIIRRLVADLNIPVEIVGCPIVREDSGLAYSSRNQYLTPIAKERSAVIYRSLQRGKELHDRGEINSQVIIATVTNELATVPEFAIEYVELVDVESLQPVDKIVGDVLLAIAGKIDNTRLIDNLVLTVDNLQ